MSASRSETGERNIRAMQGKYEAEMAELEVRVKGSLGQLQSMIQAAGEKGARSTDESGQSRLIDTKHMQLAAMQEDMTVSEFKGWGKNLDLHLETFCRI